MIRHLRWKVVATNMLLISLVLLAVFAAVYFISRGNYHKNVQQQLYQALEQGDYGRSQPGMDSIPCFVAEVYGSGTVRVAGNSYYDLSDETRMAEIVTAALAADEDAGTLDEFHLRYLRQRGYTTTAIAFTDTYLEYTSLHTLLKACSLVGCGALVVLFLCSYLLSGVVTKPVGAAWAQQEQFLSDASHELKTPLTSISGYAELIETGIAKPEDVPGFAQKIHVEASRMIQLVNDILQLSSLDNASEAGSEPEMETVDLLTVAKDCVERQKLNARRAYISLNCLGESALVHGNRALLDELCQNLCDNAIRYNRPGGKVQITTACSRDGHCTLTVADNGIGIPKEAQSSVFERFYRVDKSRSKATGGTGLGLAIVKHIARIHNARIKLESQVDVGTTITVTFPTAN